MKASKQYTDFIGTAAADISDALGGPGGDDLDTIGKHFGLDHNRFKIVGLSISGIENFHISLICIDKSRSTDEKEHIVSMSLDLDEEQSILDIIFKRFHVLIHDKFDKKYRELDYDEEVRFDEFH